MDFLGRLAAGEVVVADGAMGTQLMERGLKPGECPEAWNLERAEAVSEIARLYADAGAEVVQTNTFGATPPKLEPYGLAARAEEVVRRGVDAARRGARGRALVSLSCGPTGLLLKPYGDAEPELVYEAFARAFGAAASAGVDLVCIETMTDLAEARLAVRAARERCPKTPVLATMTFDRTKKGMRTIMGVSVGQAAKGLAEAGADVLGSNCGNGIEAIIELAREFRRETALPLLLRPNAGLPRLEGARAVYDETPEVLAGRAQELRGAGASAVGGCCGTTPAHIRALRAALGKPAA